MNLHDAEWFWNVWDSLQCDFGIDKLQMTKISLKDCKFMKRSCRVPKIKVNTFEQFYNLQFSQVYDSMYLISGVVKVYNGSWETRNR